MKSGTRSIGIAELKAHCSEIVAKVQKTGIARVITFCGAPAVELRPIENVKARERVFGGLVGTVKRSSSASHQYRCRHVRSGHQWRRLQCTFRQLSRMLIHSDIDFICGGATNAIFEAT
jgi:antitoxin (DNA-binding transcriptional repressor) of toxin-antitoxin stability system